MADRLSRRYVLTVFGSVTATVVAGCSGEDGGDGEDGTATEESPNPAQTQSAVHTETPTSTATATATEPDVTLSFDHPDVVRTDEPFEMTIDGLPDTEAVDIVMEGQTEAGTVFDARATVEPDSERLAVQEATPVDGDVPADVDVPLPVALIQFLDVAFWEFNSGNGSSSWPEQRDLRYSVQTDDGRLDSTTITREYPAIDTYVEPGDGLVGRVFEPEEGTHGPAVLVLHGSGGDPPYRVAAQLAQRGFTALALEYFDGPGLSDQLREVPLEYVKTAIDWLLAHETTTGKQVGLWGVSKGGELSLLAGSRYDEVGAVTSIVGSGLVWEGWDESAGYLGDSTWSLDGEGVPYVPVLEDEDYESGAAQYTSSLEAASAETRETATIPVENIDGPVLLVSGGDDGIWPSARLQGIAADRLEAKGHDSFDHLVYEGAGHAFLQPYFPVRGTYGTAGDMYFGGSLKGNAVAAHDHWPHVIETLSTLR
jgi:dienelactone hydrolase